MKAEVTALPKMEAVIKEKEIHFDLIIVGGGPAGLTAGLYAVRARLKCLLIEKALLGGLASTADMLENYPGFPTGISGLELSQKLEEQARRLGLDVLWGEVKNIKIENKLKSLEVDGKIFLSQTVIMATGTEPQKLEIPGEEEFRGRGISYCATCDAPFYKGKKVVVVGGGNAAVEEAMYLTSFADTVAIIHRRDELKADKILVEKARLDHKIYFIWHSILEEIHGKEKVEEVIIKDLQTDKKTRLAVDGVFIYVGLTPVSSLVKDLVKLDEQ